jgi:hypothetical protein
MVKRMHGLKTQEILLWDELVMGGNSHLLTMMELCYNVKK